MLLYNYLRIILLNANVSFNTVLDLNFKDWGEGVVVVAVTYCMTLVHIQLAIILAM